MSEVGQGGLKKREVWFMGTAQQRHKARKYHSILNKPPTNWRVGPRR